MDVNDMDYKGEEIFLDKPRHLKYTIKGLKIIAKKYGSVVEAFNKMKTMNANFDTETMDDIVMLLHAGLIHEDEDLTIDRVENMLTMNNIPKIFAKIIEAFNGSMPQAEDGGSENTEGETIPALTSIK